MELAKVILLTKDAYDSIESFLQFYSYLFDAHNITVIDNGSSDPRVLAVYEKYKVHGVTILSETSPFYKADTFMTQYMKQLQTSCEFILPMESDEFMFWLPKAADSNHRILREDVHDYLRSIPKDISVIRYGAFYGSSVCIDDPDYKDYMYSDPPRQMTKFWNQDWDKIIVRADAFVQVNQWLHHVDVSYGEKITSDTLGLLHFHDTGSKRDWERSKALVSGNGHGYLSLQFPEILQLTLAKTYRDMGAPGYHRLHKFYIVLRRKMVADMFRIMVQRLPSLQELSILLQEKDETIEHTIQIIMNNIPSYRKVEAPAITMDHLLFAEPSQNFSYQIHQVANVLQWLSESSFSNDISP